MSAPVQFDHLVVTAADLASGATHVIASLGAEMAEGGRHPRMGTYNRLMRLGSDEFLEVIAIDPDADPPAEPRWFGLDRRDAPDPVLATWVARTGDLDAVLTALPPDLCRVVNVSRGALSWRITVAGNGEPPFSGVFPTIIEWPGGIRPGRDMADRGCHLRHLRLSHPEPKTIANVLGGLIDDPRIAIEGGPIPGIAAEIETPNGRRWLR